MRGRGFSQETPQNKGRGQQGASASDTDSRACEYTVLQKRESKWKTYRALLVLFYLVASLGYVAVCAAIRFYPLMCFTPLIIWILVFLTWRYVNVAYRYEIVSGDWIFTRVMSDRFYKKMFKLKVKDAERIAPYSDRIERSRVDAFGAEKTLWAASSMDSPDLYFALFENVDGKRTVLYFEATRKALQLLSHYNKNTVMSKVRY
ncbi:MAG: hypothetical protein IKC26_08095 [Clostridia bacterium]|nr:hypothetical protein [Clostridia bacterium]